MKKDKLLKKLKKNDKRYTDTYITYKSIVRAIIQGLELFYHGVKSDEIELPEKKVKRKNAIFGRKK